MDPKFAVALVQLAAVRQLHSAHPMPFDVSDPAKYDVDARTNVCRHCSVMKGVPVVWPCETASMANAEPPDGMRPRLIALDDVEGMD